MRRRLPASMHWALIITAAVLVTRRPAGAQVPSDSIERRFRFAALAVGIDVMRQPAGTLANDVVPSRTVPRVTVGGPHFWGYADFAVTVPLLRPGATSGPLQTRLGTGVETRARVYPWSVSAHSVRPFIGGGLAAVDFQASNTAGDGPRLFAYRPMLQAGLVWRARRTIVEGGWSFRPGTDVTYPTSRTASVTAALPGSAFWVGASQLFETTASATQDVRRGSAARAERALRAAGRLSGPTFAIGLSSPILTGSDAFNRTVRPFLAPRPRGGTMLDAGAGWYFDRPDAFVNVAWRRAGFETSGYGFTQRRTRRSVAFEGAKFLLDYHGFVPFVGPVLSAERLTVRETDGQSTVSDLSRSFLAPGVLFGWDIRPTRTLPFILRTNLRWMPSLRVPTATGTEHALDQLEFNFIQLVWHPRRRIPSPPSLPSLPSR